MASRDMEQDEDEDEIWGALGTSRKAEFTVYGCIGSPILANVEEIGKLHLYSRRRRTQYANTFNLAIFQMRTTRDIGLRSPE
jgi:hypothetical protein